MYQAYGYLSTEASVSCGALWHSAILRHLYIRRLPFLVVEYDGCSAICILLDICYINISVILNAEIHHLLYHYLCLAEDISTLLESAIYRITRYHIKDAVELSCYSVYIDGSRDITLYSHLVIGKRANN